MTQALAHRGPDGVGFSHQVADGANASLGHRRLAVIDIAGGAQPMESPERGVVVLTNGEIYNYRQLRQALLKDGASFQTRSDTEVLLHGYEAHGRDVLQQLNGMFALAIWDGAHPDGPTLHLARDRMGQKPLYWAELAGGGLAFASELSALVEHPEIQAQIDPRALRRYLLHEYVPSPGTILKGVHKLAPGHVLTWQANRTPEPTPFWPRPAAAAEEQGGHLTTSDACLELRTRLGESVELRLCSDVPLGVFLSGGLDSSAIVATLAGLRDPRQISTFSVGFEQQSFDESSHARTIAEHFGTKHHEAMLSEDELLQLLPGLGSLLDEPLADPSILPTHLLARFARQHVTVTLGGDGGDELLAGYPTFIAEQGANLVWDHLPEVLQGIVRAMADELPVSSSNFSPRFIAQTFLRGQGYSGAERHQLWLSSFSPREMEQLLRPGLRPSDDADDPLSEVSQYASTQPDASGLGALLQFYARFYLADDVLMKVDRATMAVGLEARSPFLDPRLVDWIGGLPTRFKLRGRTTKWLLRRAYRGLLPTDILKRPKKGFGVPLAEWLKGPLIPLMDRILDPAHLHRQGIFEATEVQRLRREHLEGREDHHKPLWTLIAWQLWQERAGASL